MASDWTQEAVAIWHYLHTPLGLPWLPCEYMAPRRAWVDPPVCTRRICVRVHHCLWLPSLVSDASWTILIRRVDIQLVTRDPKLAQILLFFWCGSQCTSQLGVQAPSGVAQAATLRQVEEKSNILPGPPMNEVWSAIAHRRVQRNMDPRPMMTAILRHITTAVQC